MILETKDFFNQIREAIDDCEYNRLPFNDLRDKYKHSLDSDKFVDTLIDQLHETIIRLSVERYREFSMNEIYSTAIDIQKELKDYTQDLEWLGKGESLGIDYIYKVLLTFNRFIVKFRYLCKGFDIHLMEIEKTTAVHFLAPPKEKIEILFQGILNQKLIPEDTSREHFNCFFYGDSKPDDFRPLIWLGNKEEARMVLSKFKSKEVHYEAMVRAVTNSKLIKLKGEYLALAKAKGTKDKNGNEVTLPPRTKKLKIFLEGF